MKKITTILCCLIFGSYVSQAQVYSDHFDNDDPAFMGGSGTYSFAESASELTITAANTGPWDVFTYQFHDQATNMPMVIDASGNHKVFVRAKASSVGTSLRLDLQDTTGYLTSQAGISKTLTTEFSILEFDFAGNYIDGGFGGTACATGPCILDSTQIESLVMYTNPGAGGFTGTVVIDFIAFGSPPDTVITSEVFQDHFDDTTSVETISYVGQGYTVSQSGSDLLISGDGSTPIFDPLTYIFRNPNTLDTIDIDITGNNKLFIKVKSSVPGTAFRIDVQDINSFASTQASITKLVDTTYTILEYDFTGVLADLGFGGTPCTMSTAPCPVDGSRIADLLFFIEPGVGAYTGTLSIDYISFGVSLEAQGPEPDLIYEDQFNNETLEYTGIDGGFTVEEIGTDLVITGDGTASPFAAMSYLLHDKDSAQEIFLDMTPAASKVFIRAKVDSGTVPLRLDLIDTANFITSQAALTKVLTDEFQILEYDFSASYLDGGFGGTPCMTGPCPVDPKTIKQILLYPDPIQGGFDGVINIDFISIGQPLGEDVGPPGLVDYSDLMDDNTSLFISDPAGLTSVTANDEWTITGDGTSGPWGAIVYTTHNDMGEEVIANAVGSNNKLFVRAKASVDSTELRIDLQDKQEFVTNLNAVSNRLSTEYEIYEFDYSNAYLDGAFGGSPCTSSGCPVDGVRIKALQLFVNPGTGAYNGTVSIDWISFGVNTVGFEDPDYLEQFTAYPNPNNGRVEVQYTLIEAANIELVLSNIMGQTMLKEGLGTQFAGDHQSRLNFEYLPQGIYLLQVQANGKVAGTLRIVKR